MLSDSGGHYNECMQVQPHDSCRVETTWTDSKHGGGVANVDLQQTVEATAQGKGKGKVFTTNSDMTLV